MALHRYITNKNHYISITIVSIATKSGRMMTSSDGHLSITSHEPLITWPCEIRGSLTGGALARKHSSCHQLLVILPSIAFEIVKSHREMKQKSITSGNFFSFANFSSF